MKIRFAVSLFAVFASSIPAAAEVKAEYNEGVVGLRKQAQDDSGRYGSHKGGKARNQAKPGPFSAESPVLNDMAALGADVHKEVLTYALEDNLKKAVLEPVSKVAKIRYGFPEWFLSHSMEIFKLAELGIVATVALYDTKGRPWSEKAIRATQLLENSFSWGGMARIGRAVGDLAFHIVEPKSTSLPREMRRNLATAKSLLARNDTQCTGKPLQVMEDEEGNSSSSVANIKEMQRVASADVLNTARRGEKKPATRCGSIKMRGGRRPTATLRRIAPATTPHPVVPAAMPRQIASSAAPRRIAPAAQRVAAPSGIARPATASNVGVRGWCGCGAEHGEIYGAGLKEEDNILIDGKLPLLGDFSYRLCGRCGKVLKPSRSRQGAEIVDLRLERKYRDLVGRDISIKRYDALLKEAESKLLDIPDGGIVIHGTCGCRVPDPVRVGFIDYEYHVCLLCGRVRLPDENGGVPCGPTALSQWGLEKQSERATKRVIEWLKNCK